MKQVKFREIDKDDRITKFIEFDAAHMSQYTGFHDTAGHEIYEGDIIASKNNINQQVEWDDKRGMWIIDGLDHPSGQLSHWIHESVVVGNIWEDPQLVQ